MTSTGFRACDWSVYPTALFRVCESPSSTVEPWRTLWGGLGSLAWLLDLQILRWKEEREIYDLLERRGWDPGICQGGLERLSTTGPPTSHTAEPWRLQTGLKFESNVWGAGKEEKCGMISNWS